MSSTENIPKLIDVSFEELRNWVVQGMDDMEKTLLSKESNNETLDKIIREHQGNSFLANVDVPVIVENILARFSKNSLSGEITKYIYVGSRDFFGNKERASSHKAILCRMTEDMAVDDKDSEGKDQTATEEITIWDVTPNKKVSDLWEPGYSYDCAVAGKPDKESKLDPKTGDIKIWYNIKNYRIITNAKDLLTKAILNFKTGAEFFSHKNFYDGINPELAKVLEPQMQYQPVTMEYTVSDVSGIQVSERVLRGENYEWNTPDNAPLHPVIRANLQNKPQVCFNINGEIKLFTAEEKLKAAAGIPFLTIIVYGSFNAADMAQYFVSSPSIEALFTNPAFMTESPSNQADVLGITARGKKFRIVGPMQNIDFSAEGDRVFLNIGGVALIEVPPAS